MAGDLWVGDVYDGVEEFDSSGNLLLSIHNPTITGSISAEPGPAGNIWNADYYGELGQYTSTGSPLTTTFFSAFQPGLAVLGDVPGEDPLPPQDTQDYYSFTLSPGQDATIVGTSLNSTNIQVTLLASDGVTVLATGVGGSTNVTSSIQNFVDSGSGGTYYVEITGDQGSQYSLVVTKGSDFSIQPHNTYNTAQDITGVGGVLGAITPGHPNLWLLDDNLYYGPFPIDPVDLTTGAFGVPIFSPLSQANNPFGINMAYDGTNLWVNNGANFGDNTIFEIDPTTGAVLAEGNPVPFGQFTGIAFLGGNLYATDLYGDLYTINPSTFTVTGLSFTVGGLSGLTGDPDTGTLFGVAQGFPGTLYEIDPSSGSVLRAGSEIYNGLYDQDLAYANGQLFVSDTNFPGFEGGTNAIYIYNAADFSFSRSLPVATYGFASGIAAGGSSTTSVDWYTYNVQAGQELDLQTFTPGDGGLQFSNSASLQISLYDTFGNLVATGTESPDGHNQFINYDAPSPVSTISR